jgi:tight adherence protein C
MIGTALIAIAFVGFSAALLARALTLPRVRTAKALDQIRDYGFMTHDAPVVEEPRRSLVELLGGVVGRHLGRSRVASVRQSLLGAGLHTTTPEYFLGLYALSVVLIPLLLVWFAAVTHGSTFMSVMEVGIGIWIGCFLPQVMLKRRARMRMERIDREIPELVDLLLVGVEGGMGFNGAIRASSQRVEGPLGEELRLMLQQQGLGASITEALENMLERSNTPAMHSLVRTVIQGERLGVSIGQLMRTLAEEMRKRRKALAEEQAGKTPIKILFPLVFVILPSMFIIVLTPAIANIVSGFNSV